MGDKELIAGAIGKFPFWNYGMDDVTNALEEDPEAQEWVPALAEAIYGALHPNLRCEHCGHNISINWISSRALYWHANLPECRAAAILIIGKEPHEQSTQVEQDE